MKTNRLSTFIFLFIINISTAMAQDQFSIHDYADFMRYEKANSALKAPTSEEKRVVFMGNSITEAWVSYSPDFFNDNNYIGRGISGQVTHQMLLRFQADVIALKPKAVVILAGTNDIAQNSGPVSVNEIAMNIKSMAAIAKQNGIKVILCSVLPAKDYPWKPNMNPLKKIPELNAQIEAYAKANNMIYADLFSAMEDGNGGMKVPDYTTADDLVHPNKAGYAVMESIIKPILDTVLSDNKN
ncbi:GDSL-type esterase/lipase family protein [Roseivirga misakiensis]|uniref:Acylhydrolase n=1 Tax=Roseivirga misakiensis TaxID=1563681 RepID=A0A1E5T023_9BACT|nr:GDSL-type esterase/lipase family protein [Roseivirga misakiensis]OEK04721.1 acylhydrolase [Roseivirga misakiensis]